MKKLFINNSGAELLVEKNKKNIFWDNYDLIFWKKNISGIYQKNGLYLKNSWGTHERFKLNNNGTWELPIKYVKYFK